MLASLASKVAAGLAVLLLLSGYANYHLTKKVGAAQAECETVRSNDTNDRNVATNAAAEDALRLRVTQLEAELQTYRKAEQVAQFRNNQGSAVLGEFKDKVDEARKHNSALDAPADTSRLRALEATYKNRVRPEGSNEVSVPPDSTGDAATSLRNTETQ